MRLFLDDVRTPPPGWYLIGTATEMIQLLSSGGITEISLDNDLGLSDQEGYDVIRWLEEQVYTDEDFVCPKIKIHTANPVARQKMLATLESIERKLK